MIDRRRLLAAGAALPLAGLGPAAAANKAVSTAADKAAIPGATDKAAIRGAMLRATRFMTDKVAYQGGYVWSYLADFSRRWGEMEAYPTMIWTQAPGTPEMGQIFLDAWRATGDERYYLAAERAADALVRGQHPSGGWNYVIDFAGEASIRRWYETIGASGWRLEEFQHYYGNATFDDLATIECARLLLRLYVIKKQAKYRAPLARAIDFVLTSQYPSGGWPQRYPRAAPFANKGHADYTGHVTLNDEVAEENIDFLLLVLQQFGDQRVREPIRRAMDCYLALRQPMPSPGWALQYSAHNLKPAGARTYEPAALSPHTTASALVKLMDFYELTGDAKYLSPIAQSIDWLDRVEAPRSAHRDGRNQYRFIEVGTNRPLAVHRRGSNAHNGEYYVDYDMTDQVAEKRVDTTALRSRLARLTALPAAQVTRDSPLLGRGPSLLPRYVVVRGVGGSDLNVTAAKPGPHDAASLIRSLDKDGCWSVELRTTSHPWRPNPPAAPPPGFVDRGQVGDEWDTSPFTEPSGPPGISTGTFINNMSVLIRALVNQG
ncbi:pectate lyase [Sphingomonas turrisvirgatae]|uniref:Pectate lyase n=1 Tax=Sphingomonas turrisvirgatae TaxID=1888892 RepID=A0A1E3LVU5_9SPHN|nr:pectate lyase [Sphingomonas turrisvirgatae]ODP37876.1 pectate lyase [Sphingomonas turrisvirgatae]